MCFVPFSLECFGAWGQEASAFFNMAASHVSSFRDVDHFHWSEASFRRYWATALSMTVARGQADVRSVGMHATLIRASLLEASLLGTRPWAALARARALGLVAA